eukprot:Sspe_Gene.38995::Locus_18815_Transcript_1_1_Confidence_1.000_Length_2012::g.38995::m.38995
MEGRSFLMLQSGLSGTALSRGQLATSILDEAALVFIVECLERHLRAVRRPLKLIPHRDRIVVPRAVPISLLDNPQLVLPCYCRDSRCGRRCGPILWCPCRRQLPLPVEVCSVHRLQVPQSVVVPADSKRHCVGRLRNDWKVTVCPLDVRDLMIAGRPRDDSGHVLWVAVDLSVRGCAVEVDIRRVVVGVLAQTKRVEPLVLVDVPPQVEVRTVLVQEVVEGGEVAPRLHVPRLVPKGHNPRHVVAVGGRLLQVLLKPLQLLVDQRTVRLRVPHAVLLPRHGLHVRSIPHFSVKGNEVDQTRVPAVPQGLTHLE